MDTNNIKLPNYYLLVLTKFTVNINDEDAGIKDNFTVDPNNIKNLDFLNGSIMSRKISNNLGFEDLVIAKSQLILSLYLSDYLLIQNAEVNTLNNSSKFITVKINNIYNLTFEIVKTKLNWNMKIAMMHLNNLLKTIK